MGPVQLAIRLALFGGSVTGVGSSLGKNLGGTGQDRTVQVRTRDKAITRGLDNNSREVVKTVILRLYTLADIDRTPRTEDRGAGERALYTTISPPFQACFRR